MQIRKYVKGGEEVQEDRAGTNQVVLGVKKEEINGQDDARLLSKLSWG